MSGAHCRSKRDGEERNRLSLNIISVIFVILTTVIVTDITLPRCYFII
jgi:hypothetical protein